MSSDSNFSDLMLLLRPTGLSLLGVQVYGMGFDGGRIVFKNVLGFKSGDLFASGFAASGTKLFSVGKLFPFEASALRQVNIWDLKDWRNKTKGNAEIPDIPDEIGETLGLKPSPVVFEVDGRIYALAGLEFDAPDAALEVYDPAKKGWVRRRNPPFLYDYRFIHSFESHILIDKTLYVALQYPKGPWKYFSYDTVADKWDTITEPTEVEDPRAKNFLKHCSMKHVHLVADNHMVFFFHHNMLSKLYACDLNSDLDELAELHSLLPKSKKAKIEPSPESDAIEGLMEFEEYVPPEAVLPDAFCPVEGLESIADTLGGHESNHRMVAHLSGDIYCLVYFYIPYEGELCQKAQVIVFQLRNQTKDQHCFKATVLDHTCVDFDPGMGMQLLAWCKLKPSV